MGECRAERPAPGFDAGEGLGPLQEPGPAEQTGEPGAGVEGERTMEVEGGYWSLAQGESGTVEYALCGALRSEAESWTTSPFPSVVSVSFLRVSGTHGV